MNEPPIFLFLEAIAQQLPRSKLLTNDLWQSHRCSTIDFLTSVGVETRKTILRSYYCGEWLIRGTNGDHTKRCMVFLSPLLFPPLPIVIDPTNWMQINLPALGTISQLVPYSSIQLPWENWENYSSPILASAIDPLRLLNDPPDSRSHFSSCVGSLQVGFILFLLVSKRRHFLAA